MNESIIRATELRYSHGGEALLTQSWRDFGVKIDESKLFYITEGEIIINISGEEIICTPGQIVLIPAKTLHDYYMTPAGFAKKYWFHFSLCSFGNSIFDKYNLPIRIDCNSEHIKNLFLKVVTPCKTDAEIIGCHSAIHEIVAYYLSNSGATPKHSKTDTLYEIIDYISKNISESFSITALSELAHLSPNYFVRKFRERMGTTPIKYIATLRVELAKELLISTSMTISEIMENVGIYDASYFSKLFKAETGYSPRNFREISKRIKV